MSVRESRISPDGIMKGDLLSPRLASLLFDPTVAESCSFLLNRQTLTLFMLFQRRFKILALFNSVTKSKQQPEQLLVGLIYQLPDWMKCRSSGMLLFLSVRCSSIIIII